MRLPASTQGGWGKGSQEAKQHHAAKIRYTTYTSSRAPPILEMKQRFKTIQKVRLAPS
jgi:hypothetical protein